MELPTLVLWLTVGLTTINLSTIPHLYPIILQVVILLVILRRRLIMQTPKWCFRTRYVRRSGFDRRRFGVTPMIFFGGGVISASVVFSLFFSHILTTN